MRIRLCLTEDLWRGRRRPCQCPGRLPPNFGGVEKEPKRCHALSCRRWVLPAKAHWSVLWGGGLDVTLGKANRKKVYSLLRAHPRAGTECTCRDRWFGLFLSGLFCKQPVWVSDVFCVSLPVSINVLEKLFALVLRADATKSYSIDSFEYLRIEFVI